MFHLHLPAVCKRRGRHAMTKLSQNHPRLSAAENISRSDRFGDRRYWHSHCWLCGEVRTVAIEERAPGARETKRLLVTRATHATVDPRQMEAPLKLRDGGNGDAT